MKALSIWTGLESSSPGCMRKRSLGIDSLVLVVVTGYPYERVFKISRIAKLLVTMEIWENGGTEDAMYSDILP
ncbi:hypothetical protein SDC9_141379 [bioreactor metagenome]|uniref:Uncharacterized protein n=1 Tax=bioreactor metagenome TaxID=1076179 RepID=A0A645DXH6_9ZZZZ